MKNLYFAIVEICVLCACTNPQNKHIAEGSPPSQSQGESEWIYSERQDVITKRTTDFAYARLFSKDLDGAYSDVTWSCPGTNIESLAVEIDTYHRDGSPLDQDPSKNIAYRFDGVVHDSGARREYRNAALLTVPLPAISTAEHNEYGARAKIHIDHPYAPDAMIKYVAFVISDPEFALRIRVDGGDLTFEFSLDEPAIKRILTECGFDYDVRTESADEKVGLDFDVADGTVVSAVAKGVVRWAGERPGYGLMVEIDHGNGLMTRLNYNTRLFVRQGDSVLKGQKIATAGPIVHSEGSHRRFELLKEGTQIDPLKFIAEDR